MPTHQEALDRWPVTTRKEAFTAGKKHYYTGRPCKNGHHEQRSVASGICVACNRMYAQRFRDGSLANYITLTLDCHADDAETVRQFVAGINTVRDLATMTPTTPPDMTATRLAVFPELANAPPGYAPPKPVLR